MSQPPTQLSNRVKERASLAEVVGSSLATRYLRLSTLASAVLWHVVDSAFLQSRSAKMLHHWGLLGLSTLPAIQLFIQSIQHNTPKTSAQIFMESTVE